jgi:hypothetical protein
VGDDGGDTGAHDDGVGDADDGDGVWL